MKKCLTYLLVTMILINSMGLDVFATEIPISESITKLEDGSYYITVIEETTSPRSTTKSGTKTSRYYSSSDELLWSVTVKGTFSYTGSSAKCTASSVSTTCPNDNWKITSKSSSKSGAKASATATAKRYASSVPVQTVTKTVTLTCSPTGILS